MLQTLRCVCRWDKWKFKIRRAVVHCSFLCLTHDSGVCLSFWVLRETHRGLTANGAYCLHAAVPLTVACELSADLALTVLEVRQDQQRGFSPES